MSGMPHWEYADFPVVNGVATTPRGQIMSSSKVVRVPVLMGAPDALWPDIEVPPPDLYPGRPVIVYEMLAAWKERNAWWHAYFYGDSALERRVYADGKYNSADARLAALRRVWRALRAIR